MVHKFSIEEVTKTWKHLISGMRQVFTISEADEKALFNKCLLGISQVWAGFNDDNKKLPVFFALTTIGIPEGTGTKALFISHLYSVSEVTISQEIWKGAFDTIVKFAKEKKCERIDCVTTSPLVLELFKSLSPEVEERLYLTTKI